MFESIFRSKESQDKPTNGQNGHNGHNGNGHNDHSHLIDLQDVVKLYQTPAGPFTALNEVDLHVNSGEFVAVIGKSGSGKSTLINMITGIDRPTSGQVFVGGAPVHTLNEGQLAAWRGRNIGVIFQFFQLLPTLTILENVMLPMDFCHMYSAQERPERAIHLLEQVDLAEHAHKLPSAVSGGQQQRAAIARALANDPPILVADEPTGNLDSKTADSVFQLFEQLVNGGKTIMMVTHDRDLARRATRTVIISDGEIIEEYLARTFPALTEEQLVEATRELDPLKHAPGAVILREGGAPDGFYLITKGQVEVLVRTGDGGEIVASRMGRGQYFGEIELLRGGANIATIRADPMTGAEVATLDRESFGRLVAESEAVRAAVEGVVQERLAENSAAREHNED